MVKIHTGSIVCERTKCHELQTILCKNGVLLSDEVKFLNRRLKSGWEKQRLFSARFFGERTLPVAFFLFPLNVAPQGAER